MLEFDAVAATQAYLDSVPAELRARSDAYFEGGYWLQAADFAIGLAVNLAILALGLSRRMREAAERLARRRPVQDFAFWTMYVVVATVPALPFMVYRDF